MALTSEEQKLFDLAKRAMPDWYSNDERANEFLGLAAKAIGVAKAQGDFFFNTHAFIKTADLDTGVDWLNQLAVDRGTRRGNGETTAALRDRLRGRVKATYGTGGAFTAPVLTGGKWIQTFTPTNSLGVRAYIGDHLVLFAASNARNNSPVDVNGIGPGFTVTGVSGNTISYENFNGVSSGGTDAAVGWELHKVGNDAVTRIALLSGAEDLMDVPTAGPATAVAMVELPRDQAFIIATITQNTGTGGTFTSLGSNVFKFQPTVKFAYPPYRDASGRVSAHKIVFTGAGSAGNNGTFTITGLEGDAAKYTNASGVGGADASVAWKTERHDSWPSLMDTFPDSFIERGYRIGLGTSHIIIVILPYTTGDPKTTAIRELMRQRKAAGVVVVVEERLMAP